MKKLTDRSFVKLAQEKGLIVKKLGESLPRDWCWMVIEESPDKLVVEIRHITTNTEDVVEYTK